MKIYLKATPHVIKHLGRVLTHVAEHKAANAAINKGISTGKSAVKGAPSASPKPSPLTPNATQAGSKGFHWNIHSPFQFFWHFPWLIPILIVGAYFGLRWYWPKLEIKSNIKGQPLAPYSVYFKKIKALMYHEDKTLVFENNAFMYSKFPNLTWQQYWRIHTGLIIADLLALFFVPTDIFSIFFLIPLFFIIPLVFLGFYGSKRIKAIFGQRDRTLMQMFQVASSAFKYPPGAKLNPSGWVQIQQWGDPQNLDLSGEQQLFRPGSTYMMFPPATPSESQGLRESFERNFNGTVTADNTWEYEWESSNNRVLAKPVPFISDKTVQYPFPDKNPWNIFVLGDAGSGKVASFDVSKTPHLLVAGTSGSGKQLSLMSSIPTPSGWTTMGEIKVGDYVFDENGKPTKVLTVFDIDPNADLYRVMFSDGSYIDADAEHLWRTENQQSLSSRRNSKRKVVERRPLVSEEGISNLIALRNKLSPHNEITIDEIIYISGIPYYSTWLTEIYNQVGHVGEIQIKIQQHYKEQVVRQHQKVTYYPAKEAWDSLVGYTGGHYTFLAERKETFVTKKNYASPTDMISATEIMKTAGFANRRAVLQFFKSKGIKGIIVRELVELQVPERISEKLSKPIRSYNAHALINAILERAQTPANDQRYKKTYSSVITTNDIASTLKFGALKTHINHSIPVAKPLDLPEADLPIPSYTYGVWLGDGTAVRGEFCGIDHEIAELVKDDGFNDLLEKTPKNRPIGTSKEFRVWFSPHLHTLLKDNGLIRIKFPTKERKYIPEAYLRASIEQRKMLLAGLLDTDGTVTHGGGAEFCNTNKNIAFGAYELALSLGYRATIREGRSKLNGKDYGIKWTVSFAPLESPFRLSRKTATFNERSKNRNPEMLERRYITAVEKIPNGPARCIMVDSPSHMFLAGREMIPTHNSVTQRTLLMHALQSPDWRVALVDPKRVELAAYRNHKHVMRVATELDESLELIIDVEKEMQTRYMKMQDESVNFFRNLRQPPPAFLLMIDETYALLAPEKIKNDEGKLRDEMHAQITLLIGSIARLGRAAGVHLMLATQRPDAAVLPGETKPLDIRTPILTLDGWRTIEDLQENDYIFDENGKAVRVIKATDIMYNRECYEIEFSDGEKIIADSGHLWESHDCLYRMSQTRAKGLRLKGGNVDTQRQPIVITTKEMLDTLVYNGKKNHAIPVAPALEFPEADLPISPYLMGSWLGDGVSRTGVVCGIDREIVNYIIEDGDSVYSEIPDKRGTRHKDFRNWRITGLTQKLDSLGLLQRTTEEGTKKYIPDIYLRSSIEQRKLLLQGLMDTDGHYAQRIRKNGDVANSQAVFTTCLSHLADQTLELVRSLGYRATINTERKRDAVTAQILDPIETVYHVKWTPRETPFRLTRKTNLLNGKLIETERTKYRYVVNILPVPSVPVKCIAVDSESHLFLVGKALIPTHNSNLDARIAQGRMDTTPSNMTLDSDRATRIPNIKGRAVLRTGQDYTEFQAFFLPEEQLPLVLEMSEALATGRIHISAFEPDAPEEDEMPERSRFSWLQRLRIPRPTFNAKLPFGLSEKISDFMENRRTIAEENDAHLQAKIEYAKNGGKGDFNAGGGKGADRPRRGSQRPPEGDFEPNQEEDEDELDINSIANAARERGIHADETSLISPRRSAISSRRVRVDPEASFEDFDEEHLELESFDNDDRDIDEHDYQNALNEERPVRSSIVSRLTRSPRLHSTPALDEEHFENNLETGIEPEYHADHEEITISEALKEIEDLGEALALSEDFSDFNMQDPHLTDLTFDLRNLRPITIEQVIAKADQLGVPISASELREALAYEAVLEAAGMPVPEVSIPTPKERLDPIVDDIDDSNVREYIGPSPIAIPLVDFGPDSKQRDFPDEDRGDYLMVPNSIPMVDKPQEREQNHPILEDAQEIIEIPMPGNILPSVSPGIFASTFIPSMPVRPKRASEQSTQETIAVEELLRDQKALSAEAAAEQAWIPVPVNYNSEPQEAPWMPKDITENPLGGSPFGNLES